MRDATPALADYLVQKDTFVIVDLYTFALPNGLTLRYSGWTTALAIPGSGFPTGSLNYDDSGVTDFALGPRFGRSKVTTKIGVEPTELDIEIIAGAGDRIGSFHFFRAVPLREVHRAPVET